MIPNTISMCQKAYGTLKDQLSLSEERFMDACNIAAAACDAANPIATLSHGYFTKGALPNYTSCINWVASVGGWLITPDNQAHLKPYDMGVIPSREEPYLTLFRLNGFAQYYRQENFHPRIHTLCHKIASDAYRNNRLCGTEENIEKVCQSVAYLKCQAPLPRDTPSRVDQSFAVIECMRKIADDPDVSLYDISAQVYYYHPPSAYQCAGSGYSNPNEGMKLPEPPTTTCVNPPAPPREMGPVVELQTSMMMGMNARMEQVELGTGVHLKNFMATTGVAGSRHSDGVSDPVWSGGIYIGGNWAFWRPAPSVAFALTAHGSIEMGRVVSADTTRTFALYPAIQAGAGVSFPELVGRYLVPQITVGYGLQGQRISDTTQWLHSLMVALNISSRL